MSYLDFDYTENSILVCKGDSRNRKKITIKRKYPDYSEYFLNEEFNGIEITDFLSTIEQDGLKGELKFKELLDKNNIPYLYIGQGPFGIERSGVLIDKTKSKRADFLVNIKDMGTILFDAKCRNKIGFHNSKDKYFTLFTSEFEALRNLQNSILMPVWLAFTDRQQINTSKEPTFYFISISTIEKYWSGICDFFTSNEDFESNKVIRIPNSLFTKIEDKIIFEVGFLNIEDDLLNEYAKKYIGLNRIIKDKIKDIIRNNNCYKSNIYNELTKNKIHYCYPYEVNNCVNNMIEKRIIEYKPKQYLKLVGE
ncbi:hypothetical protein FEZ18_05140 [Oceanihabitans sp. IOP_32]|uniref:hypothetical protein n=1 Tax=Oceanihabitans sp. IOP_32 TaxID=2529032 RepID=UPI00129386D8|nr:hypothetical protein [Oceanihabitans sp. IOP_32]QFZ54225.1 hypothetical protein FEZ18_05140 [Oceanihabitans sp. IOP_32]